MLFPSPVTSPQQPLQGFNVHNQNNHGIIGDSSNNIVVSGDNSQVNITQITTAGEDVELDRLLDRYISKDALHNSFYSPPECHPNTRTTVLNEIGGWIDESGSSPLLWLSGPAAVGKSVIAKTISTFHDEVVAAFFFSTSSDKTAATLFPTLAWQLARRIPDTRKHIITSLKDSGSLHTSQIEEQFDRLIIQPLKNVTALQSRPVMVIDGVDECTNERILIRFLQVLALASKHGDMPVRFIICSRPEPSIYTILGCHDDNLPPNKHHLRLSVQMDILRDLASPMFEYIALGIIFKSSLLSKYLTILMSLELLRRSLQWRSDFSGIIHDLLELYRPIRLDTAPSEKYCDSFTDASLDTICQHPVISTIRLGFSKECKEDIARYLTDRFNAIPQPAPGTCPWLQPSEISDLVEASRGQFLYVSTIVRLLDEPRFDPRDVLKMACRSSLPTPDLNGLYKAILKRAEDTIHNQAQEGGPDYHTEWRIVTDSLSIQVFFARNDHFFTVHKNFLVTEALLDLESGKLTKALSMMHSVLRILPGNTIQVHHRSFLEFLQNKKRSGQYYIAYSTTLRQMITFITRGLIKYTILHPFKDDANEKFECIESIIREYYQYTFGRSRFSSILFGLHILIHFYLTNVLCKLPLSLLPLNLFDRLPIMFYFLAFIGAYILSLIIYTLLINHSILVPFFHPFLHSFIIIMNVSLLFLRSTLFYV